MFAPAVKARELPARWKWDCSIKRPQCVVTPETLAPHSAITPDLLAIEHDDDDEKRGNNGKKPEDPPLPRR